MGKLTALKVSATKKPGMYGDGDGLYLQVTSATARSWIWSYTRNGKAREMGLGSVDDVSLQQARQMRDDWRRRMRVEGIDPVEAR